ncbi:MAG: hypothetical protein ACXVMS_05650 [Flavisolibacter sp.]
MDKLHENIAQAIAATKFYLEMAEGEEAAKDELQKSKGFLLEILKQVSALSDLLSATPT